MGLSGLVSSIAHAAQWSLTSDEKTAPCFENSQAIALFFYAIKTHKSSYLGTGVSVKAIVQEIFGGVDAASSLEF